MSADRHLSRQQFRLHHQPPIAPGHWEPDPEAPYEGAQRWIDEDPATGSHMLTASTGNNRPLGFMTWDKGTVKRIEVNERWQHKGMATQMWERASQITPGLRHSDNRTEMGEAWSKAVGGEAPERVQDHPEWHGEEIGQ